MGELCIVQYHGDAVGAWAVLGEGTVGLVRGPEAAEGEGALHYEHVAFAVGSVWGRHHDYGLAEAAACLALGTVKTNWDEVGG